MHNRIRELRKKQGITMKQLGLMFGFGEATISQYETGKRQPSNETLLKLSEYFGVTVEYLLGAEPKEATPSVAVNLTLMRLKQLRIEFGKTQSQIAQMLDVDRTTYVKYESSHIEPPITTLIRLSKYFGVSLGYLAGIEKERTPPAISEDGQQDIVKRNVIRLAGRDGSIQERYLSDEQLSAVKSILDQLPDASDDL